MSKQFVGKFFADAVMSTPSGDGVGVEKSNGITVRDAGAAGKRTPNDQLDVNEVTTYSLEGAPGMDAKVTIAGSGILTSPALRKGLDL